MISPKLEAAINEQINKELFSAYLYLAMAAHFEAINLPGFAKWMKVQAEEERGHGMKMWDYLYERGAKVVLKAIENPTKAFGRPREIFEEVLAHERKVTALINALHALAVEEKDPATEIFLQWFVTEQVEEEKNASDLVEQLKMSGDQSFGLLFMDQHVLGERK
jgi:ferritin